MASVSLTEQLGAVSVIDALRHREMMVQDHLSLALRRQEAAQRIAEYYQSRNVAVDDALIEQGVRDYFDRRLCFEAPTLTAWQRLASRAYITRAQWAAPVGGTTMGAVLVAVLIHQGVAYQEHERYEQLVQTVQTSQFNMQNLQETQKTLRARVTELQQWAQNQQLSGPQRLLHSLAGEIEAQSPYLSLTFPKAPAPENRVKEQASVDQLNLKLASAQEALQNVGGQLSTLNAFHAAFERFNSQRHTDTSRNAPHLSATITSAEKTTAVAFEQADTTALVNAAIAQAKQFDTQQSNLRQAQDLHQQLEVLRTDFNRLGLKRQDMESIQALLDACQQSIALLDIDGSKKTLTALGGVLEFAKTPVTLQIVDRSGVKSGIERTFKASGGKSWYVVAEAVDASGKVVPMPVKSIETGDRQLASMFGVRVEEPVYKKVREDKRQDGHVDDKLLGRKPANSLSVVFEGKTSERPDMILEW